MHEEWGYLSKNTSDIINNAIQTNKRIISVGTTSLRILETVARLRNGLIEPWSGVTDLFITPGFQFKIVDLLITNFHLPKSTLLMLVSAFHGKEKTFERYQYAIKQKYRFFSYGDSCIFSKENKLIALDAKMSFDNNSLFRQPEVLELKDETEEEPSETISKKFDLAYIKLHGGIGCLVNGAGLAMATMDIINLKGSSPANFLDVGGSATKEKVKEAFKIILSDDAVKGILVNIFGGIMRCDIIAEGVVAAASDLALDKPLVVRLSGTNVEKGKEILSKSDLQIISADDLDDAAEKIVNAVKG